MENLKKFKQYFNRDFWRAFQDKQYFFDIPKNKAGKDSFVEKLYREIEERRRVAEDIQLRKIQFEG